MVAAARRAKPTVFEEHTPSLQPLRVVKAAVPIRVRIHKGDRLLAFATERRSSPASYVCSLLPPFRALLAVDVHC